MRRASLVLVLLAACTTDLGVADPDKEDTPEVDTDESPAGDTASLDTAPASSDDTADTADTAAPPVDTAPVPVCPPGIASFLDGAPFGTVQEAFDQSLAGSTIEVCPGSHTLAATLSHAGPLTVVSRDGDPLTTQLVGDGTNRLLTLPTGARVAIEGLTWLSGRAYDGAAIKGSNLGRLTIRDCVFSDHQATYNGGALAVSHTPDPNVAYPILIEDTLFSGNSAGYEGGAASVGNGGSPQTLRLERVTFLQNTADYEAGALELDSSGGRALLRNVGFRENHADYEAGALAVNRDLEMLLEDCLFEDNTSGYQFSALALDGEGTTASAEIVRGAFRRNSSPAEGAVGVDDFTLTLTDVDLGAGSDDNAPVDIEDCDAVDGTTSGSVDRSRDPACLFP